jgi:hypothetical protein
MTHVVMFSGGIGSWAAAQRVVDKHGPDGVVLLFADVKGNNTSPHAGEDEDTYRFIADAAAQLDCELVTINEGRDIWQVFKDRRFLGNSRLANCSHELKQKPARAWLDANCDPDNTTVYVGIDWSESHRLPAIRRAYLPYAAEAPLTEPPYLTKQQMLEAAESAGLHIPRAYTWGMSHNNCGGGCVRAGQAQFATLLRVYPERFVYWEQQEQAVRDHIGRDDVAILRQTTGGVSTPVTLRQFREQITQQPALFDEYDVGGCGCFTDYDDTTNGGDA